MPIQILNNISQYNFLAERTVKNIFKKILGEIKENYLIDSIDLTTIKNELELY